MKIKNRALKNLSASMGASVKLEALEKWARDNQIITSDNVHFVTSKFFFFLWVALVISFN